MEERRGGGEMGEKEKGEGEGERRVSIGESTRDSVFSLCDSVTDTNS